MLREDKKVQDNMNYKLDKDEMQKSNGIKMAKYEPGISYKDLQELPLTCPQCLITIVSVEDLEVNLLCLLCGTSYQLITRPLTSSIKEYASLRQIDKIEKLLLKGKFVPSKNDMSYISIRKILRHRLHLKSHFLIQKDNQFDPQEYQYLYL